MQVQKLYSPVYCRIRYDENLEYYDGDYQSDDISQSTAAYYTDEINAAIRKLDLPDEAERGLMAYYHDGGEVDEKVHSLRISVEEHGGKLWGTSTLELAEPLAPDELDTILDWVSGQYSDGAGESLEQREIKISEGELYVSLWDPSPSFRIMTESEFAREVEQQQDIDIEEQHLPPCPLVGADGNVFNLIGLASRTLKEHGMKDEE